MKNRTYLTDQYLDSEHAGLLTPATYLSKMLTGKAKKYMSDYRRRMIDDLERLTEAGSATTVQSVGGSVAYKRVDR